MKRFFRNILNGIPWHLWQIISRFYTCRYIQSAGHKLQRVFNFNKPSCSPVKLLKLAIIVPWLNNRVHRVYIMLLTIDSVIFSLIYYAFDSRDNCQKNWYWKIITFFRVPHDLLTQRLLFTQLQFIYK